MKTYTKEELNKIREQHKLWLNGEGGERAYLSGADLSGAYLRGAYLRGADLIDADLSGADLSGVNLNRACLMDAYLRGADLIDADLSGADLSGANLIDADLSGADLSGAILLGCAGNNKEIKSIFIFEEYQVTYTKEALQIGCQQHPISDWWEFDDRAILEMDGKKALKFWRENKNLIRSIVESKPAC